MERLSFEKRAVIFIIATLGLRTFFFLTANQNEFPTGEVYLANAPALEHPYQQPWQSPYGILWYWITEAVSYASLPFVKLLTLILSPSCTCLIHLTNLDGHTVTIPYTYPEWLLGLSMMLGYTIISLPFYWLLRKSLLLPPFFISDNFFWVTTPANVPILLLAVLGIFSWKFLPLAPLAKLPVGAPMAVWQYAFNSALTPGHWFPYIMYGLWWIGAILRWLPWKHSWNFRPDRRELELSK